MTIKRRGLRNAPTVIEPKSDDPGYVWGRYYSDARGAGITPKITEPLPDDPGYVWNRYYDLAKTFGPSARMAGSRRSGGAAAGDEKALSTLYDRLDTHKAAEHLEPGVDPNVGRLAFALNMSDTKLQERVAKGEIEYKFTPEQRKQFAVYASAIDEIRDGREDGGHCEDSREDGLYGPEAGTHRAAVSEGAGDGRGLAGRHGQVFSR